MNSDLKDMLNKEIRDLKAELSTWKTRAEKAEARLAGLDLTNFNKLIAERDTLKARCEKLEGYAEHKADCLYHSYDLKRDKHGICTCGLDELRKQGEEG